MENNPSPITDNNIQVRNISSLSGLHFFIPDYQRGYRWGPTQAIQMMKDFISFCNKTPKNLGEYYCMQPVVVKPKKWKDDNNDPIDGFEVIDGQQRLTTLFILFKALTKTWWEKANSSFILFDFTYESREVQGSSVFLNKIDDDVYTKQHKNDFVDFFYMKMVYDAIKKWLNDNNATFDIPPLLLKQNINNNKDDANNVRIIWYEVGDDTIGDGKTNSIEIFTRLNIGKIPLTNAELIKALLLRKTNFENSSPNEIQLKQIQIAEEWNLMEQSLQNDAFWYFMYNISNPLKYDTRIEFIFDLMKEKSEDDGYSYTFEKFNEEFEEILTTKGDPVDKIWGDIKKYYRILEYWYHDRHLFHYVGFLVETGNVKLLDLIKLYNNTLAINKKYNKSSNKEDEQCLFINIKSSCTGTGMSKKDFSDAIKKIVYFQVKDLDLDKLKYSSKETRTVLLLFNILTVLESDRSDLKFPFEKYKEEHWDKEHIVSQTDKPFPDNDKKRIEWIDDMIFYFTETTIPKDADHSVYCKALDEKICNLDPTKEQELIIILNSLKKLKEDSIIESKKDGYKTDFKTLYDKLKDKFDRDNIEEEDKDNLSNMALLNASINRSYGNAFFAIKRQFIKENDSSGVFVPIATKNAFMKYYSTNVNNMMSWSKEDARAYLQAIKNKINTLK